MLLAVVLAAPGAARRVDDHGRFTLTAADEIEGPLLARINRTRRAHDLRPLRLAKGLVRAAEDHARSMARNGYFSHSSPDGTSVESRIRRYYPASAVGETLLWHAGDLGAAQALEIWLGSPGHRAILLGPSFRDVGLAGIRVADAPGAFRGLDVTILVAEFGTR